MSIAKYLLSSMKYLITQSVGRYLLELGLSIPYSLILSSDGQGGQQVL